MPSTAPDLVVHPLTPDRWPDLEALFGPQRGAQGGCWCMWFRLARREFDEAGKDGRKRLLRMLVERGPPPGLLGYLEERPVAWVAVAPREDQPVVLRSRITKPVDEAPAWAITCFYIAPGHRRSRLMQPLVQAALAFAGENGAVTVEGYPIDPPDGRVSFGGYHGFATTFRACGFQEIARRSPLRPIMSRPPARIIPTP